MASDLGGHYVSGIMRKPAFCICKNKAADTHRYENFHFLGGQISASKCTILQIQTDLSRSDVFGRRNRGFQLLSLKLIVIPEISCAVTD